jgi:hypothetical protein
MMMMMMMMMICMCRCGLWVADVVRDISDDDDDDDDDDLYVQVWALGPSW